MLYLAKTIPRLNGMYSRNCNVCGYEGKFLAFGTPPRLDARCPKCGCLERHRLFQLWLENNTDLVSRSDILHFAPEAMIRQLLVQRAKSYRGADLSSHKADLILNIENIDLPDSSVDIIICSHVLEHVDDTRALNEMFRVLRPEGVALLMFPIVEGWQTTYEDPSITNAADRLMHFGQKDHVRIYGRDVRKRVSTAGFKLEEFTAVEPYVRKHGLLRGETMFFASKPTAIELAG